MSEWREHVLGDLIAYAIGGGWGEEAPAPGLRAVQVVRGADFPEVEVGDVTNLPVRYETPKRFAARNLESGDIVLEISGGTKGRPTGRVVRMTESLLADSSLPLIPASFCRLVRPDPDAVDPEFLYYLLLDWYKRGGSWAFQNQSTGIANFQFKMFMRNFEFLAPQLTEQRAIAEVLEALDDKIEANRKLAATANALAESLYRRAISGLERVPMSQLLEPQLGATPKRSVEDYWGGERPWVSAKDIANAEGGLVLETDEAITDLAVSQTRARPLPIGSVVLTARGTVGKVARLGVPAAFNQSCYAFVPDSISPALLYLTVRQAGTELTSLVHGSVFDTITTRTFDHVQIPDVRMVPDAATGRLTHLLALTESKAWESRHLSALRDTLLPKLMSGQLRVEEVAERAGL